MDELDIETVADPDLRDPVLVEGLPGVGHVGKLAVEHLLEEKESELVRRVYSEHFPPQVTVSDDGTTELACAEIHAVELDDRDLLILTGDNQASDNAGHYRLTDAFLDVAEAFGVETVYALGGVPTGELMDEYAVVGAATDTEFVEELEDAGVEFREDEPAGGIVGTSGLLLGLGERRDLRATCLMGETSGYLVDPKSARAVLEVLEDVLGFEVEYDSLEERADDMEDVANKIQEMENQQSGMPTDENLRYIG
ncbi:proteasome assembly chaperone family protein [Halorussus sp. MSC15.2]|uniref:proteasome assembly chaperone family protein n=1 Tax=Halorussus sp. MSC15.2 TaxID=2283638 RepID=UPI0013D7341A|nr:proteasome assembly chaperone family protein [Halorussus sp. MSC15.2]NEU57602.1 proteasome assembly chaperone family protein [Halorussus sp. MSC15.2]